jgi:hypothetical protein
MINLNSSGDENLSHSGQHKFEIVNCPHNCPNCKLIFFEINEHFHESEEHQIDKEYQLSVVSLKKAFEKTYELTEPVQQECSNMFRLHITKSMEAIFQELQNMTTGFFWRGRYKRSLMMSEETLKEFKKLMSTGEQGKIQDSTSKDQEINLPVV